MSSVVLDPINEIEEHLYLGGFTAARSLVLDYDIAFVLSISEYEVSIGRRVDGITYEHIHAYDTNDQDLLTYFPQTYQLIDKYISSGQNVLIHCHAGISRSATIVIAYVMQKYKMSVQSAIDLVKAKRNLISPNNGFIDQLNLFEEMQFTLDAKNQTLRHYLMQCYSDVNDWNHNIHKYIARRWVNTNDRNQLLVKYFERRSLVEGMSPNLDFGQQYDCSNCGFKLFNEIHIIETTDSNADIDCLTIDVEPQEWMENDLTSHGMVGFGTINCKNCTEIKGDFFTNPCLRIEMMTKSYVKH